VSPFEHFDNTHAVSLTGTGPGAGRRELRPGDIIGGLYRLKAILGQGGMGYVFRAEHTVFHRDYALKMLAPELLNDESRQRFEMEGRAIANLEHVNIVKVYDMGLDEANCPYYVMDLLDGQPLSECIKEGEPISFAEVMDIFRQVAAGLGYAHSKGIVHRDVKPSNIILLPPVNGRRQVKIVDFGIVKLLPTAQLGRQASTATGAVFGTPYYMSPEQCLGSKVDQRSDIYSLGCTLFETLCGKPPFAGASAMATVMMHQEAPVPSVLQTVPRAKFPQSVDYLMEKMLAKRPDNRYQSMDQVAHDLGRIKHGKSVGAVSVASSQAGGNKWVAGSGSRDIGQESASDENSDAGKKLGLLLKLASLALVTGLLICTCLTYPYIAGKVKSWASSQRERVKSPEEKSKEADRAEKLKKAARGKEAMEKVEKIGSEMLNMPFKLTEQEESLDSQEVTVRSIFAKSPLIKSHIVVVDGVRRKHFRFPEWSVGRVITPGVASVSAYKDVFVSVDRPLILEVGAGPSKYVLRVPEILDKIDGGEFSGIIIAVAHLDGFQDLLGGTTKKTAPLMLMLQTLSRWSRLERMVISGMPVTARDCELLNRLTHLRELELHWCYFDMKELAKQPFLRNLKAVGIEEAKKVAPLCDKLAGSPNLEELLLFRCDTTVADIQKLSTCRRLRRLDLQDAEFAPLVPAVAHLKSLEEVHFVACPLNIQQIKMLTASPHIKRLILSRTVMASGDLRWCAQYEPKVSFDD
jgi:serine/threonine protein kinase